MLLLPSCPHGGQDSGHIDYLDESIGDLSVEIERVIAPFSKQVELLDTIPGVNRRTAQTLIAEIGVDMSQFPTHRHPASSSNYDDIDPYAHHKPLSHGEKQCL